MGASIRATDDWLRQSTALAGFALNGEALPSGLKYSNRQSHLLDDLIETRIVVPLRRRFACSQAV
jgi:hypothetical protein